MARLARAGQSQAEIARELGVSKPTVCFHMRSLGFPPNVDFARRYDWDAIRAFYDAGNSFRACQERFGFSRNAWWDAIRRGVIVPRAAVEALEDVLSAGRRRDRGYVKRRLLAAGLKDERCEICGLSEWRGALAVQLHHMNGDGLDNRLENLQLLWPNCHSQTETWGGRNSRRRRGES